MSEHELPEEMLNWPQRAHELLGITPHDDERALKRAYTRLIRRFKPDHHPQQFARIRAAYEELLQQIAWRAKCTSSEPEEILPLDRLFRPNPPPAPRTNPEVPAPELRDAEVPAQELETDSEADSDVDSDDVTSARESLSAPASEQNAADDPDAAWEVACEGEFATGYRRLVNLRQTHRGDETLCARLYWLLRLIPELDSDKDCSEWLVEALQENLEGNVWYLYSEELKRRPELIEAPGNGVLGSTRTSVSQLLTCFTVRWRAAAEVESWILIQRDLRHFRTVLLNDATITWGRLLFLAVDLAAWSSNVDAYELVQTCGKELDELTELQLDLCHEYERHDIVREIARSRNSNRNWPFSPTVIALVRAAWLNDYDEIRPLAQHIVADWVQDPHAALGTLEGLKKRDQALFYQLRSVIQNLDLSDSWRDDDEQRVEMSQVAADFLQTYSGLGYQKLRPKLLEFCIEQHLTLPDVQGVFHSQPLRYVTITAEMLAQDLPLNVLLHGIAAFWS